MNNQTKYNRLQDKIFGCVYGGAIGDAMGAPVEDMHYLDIIDMYGRVEDLIPLTKLRFGGRPPYEISHHFLFEAREGYLHEIDPTWHHSREILNNPFCGWSTKAGTYTDDMRYRVLAYQCFVQQGRPFTSYEFAEYLQNYWHESENTGHSMRREWARGFFNFNILTKIAVSGMPFYHPEINVGWGTPGGMIHPGDPSAAARDGSVLAAGIAEAMKPQATVDSVIGAILDHAYTIPSSKSTHLPFMSDEFLHRTNELLGLAQKYDTVFDIIPAIYEKYLANYPPYDGLYMCENIPVAIAMFFIAKGDLKLTILGSANFGRDCDSIACIAGELAGALNGIKSFPEQWIQCVHEANAEFDLDELSISLYRILADRLDSYSSILNSL